MILFLFFLSGATALVYEVVWSKYLSLMFGSTVHAQTVVLAAFMGGLSLGNGLIGARSDSAKNPLRVYGILELLVGFFAFFFQEIYKAADSLFILVGTHFPTPGPLLFLKLMVSVILLLPPTILMGGTLPLVAAWLEKKDPEAERKSARFYAVNSLGAVLGAGFGGFFLIQFVGLIVTLQMMGSVNMLVGLAAILIAKRQEQINQEPAIARHEKATISPAVTGIPWALTVSLVVASGAASMGLEILAARSLSLISEHRSRHFQSC